MNLHIQKSGKNSKGFYIALGACLIAVGVAAWTTYDSVVHYAAPGPETQSSSAAPANNTVSGVYASEPESSSQAAVSSSSKPESGAPSSIASKPAVSSAAPAKQTGAKVWTYSYPVDKTILQKFSEDPIFCQATGDWRAHTGLDLTANANDPVKAIADGKVTRTYQDDRYGSTAVIQHGSVEAWYCGLGDTKVRAGDTVTAGQEIGTVGTVPIESVEGPHLHLVLKENGKYVDPITLLK